VFERIGLVGAELPHLNASPRQRNYREYFNTETRDKLGQIYTDDIETFGYRFELTRPAS
jgi:hypothetical protein